MKTQIVVGALLCGMFASVLGGCGSATVTWTPEGKMLASRETFNSAVNAVSAAIEGGRFDDDEAKQILRTAKMGEQILDRFDAAVELGQPTSELIRQFNYVLREMVAYRNEAAREEDDSNRKEADHARTR